MTSSKAKSITPFRNLRIKYHIDHIALRLDDVPSDLFFKKNLGQ